MSVNLQSLDIVSFDFVSLFTNVPVDEALQVISNKAIMEMLEVCLRTTYFQMDKFFQQKDGMTMGITYH
jgi:hypothetical protein